MSRLDRFSRFEQWVYQFFAYFVILGAPFLGIFLSDAFFLNKLSPFIRYPLWPVCGIIGAVICLTFMEPIQDFFLRIRKVLKMKPLAELEEEAEEQRAEAELNSEAERHTWFTGLRDSEQSYRVYLLQHEQLVRLNDIRRDIETVKFLVVAALLFYFISRIFL